MEFYFIFKGLDTRCGCTADQEFWVPTCLWAATYLGKWLFTCLAWKVGEGLFYFIFYVFALTNFYYIHIPVFLRMIPFMLTKIWSGVFDRKMGTIFHSLNGLQNWFRIPVSFIRAWRVISWCLLGSHPHLHLSCCFSPEKPPVYHWIRPNCNWVFCGLLFFPIQQSRVCFLGESWGAKHSHSDPGLESTGPAEYHSDRPHFFKTQSKWTSS